MTGCHHLWWHPPAGGGAGRTVLSCQLCRVDWPGAPLPLPYRVGVGGAPPAKPAPPTPRWHERVNAMLVELQAVA